jgi:hypothetical protein
MMDMRALLAEYGSYSAITAACDRAPSGVYVLKRKPDGSPIRQVEQAKPVRKDRRKVTVRRIIYGTIFMVLGIELLLGMVAFAILS